MLEGYSVRRMRWRWGIAVLVVAVGTMSPAGLAANRVPGSHPWVSDSYIKRFALKAAAVYGDPHPTLIQHAAGTRYEANVVASGDLIYDWSWAYLIAMRGHFRVTSTYASDGSNPPADGYIHGSVLTIVLNPRTGEGEDLGVSNHYPHLAKLGHVTTDYRRGRRDPKIKVAGRSSRYGRVITDSAH